MCCTFFGPQKVPCAGGSPAHRRLWQPLIAARWPRRSWPSCVRCTFSTNGTASLTNTLTPSSTESETWWRDECPKRYDVGIVLLINSLNKQLDWGVVLRQTLLEEYLPNADAPVVGSLMAVLAVIGGIDGRLRLGGQVVHEEYGEGTVTRITPKGRITVQFYEMRMFRVCLLSQLKPVR